MKRRLLLKMILRIWGGTMVLLAAIIGVNYYYINQEVKRGVWEHADNLTENLAEKLEGRLKLAAAVPEMVALNLEQRSFDDEEDLKTYMRKVLLRNRHVYGSCIAFEPHFFDTERRLFAPYYYMDEEEPVFVQLGNEEYDYFKWDWYKLPKQALRALWSEPYYDEGGGETLMITRSVPFFKGAVFRGVVTIDLALDELTDEVGQVKVEKTGYAFLVSKEGQLVAYPDKSKIMKSNITDLNHDLAKRLASGESGMMRGADPLRGRESFMVHRLMSSAEMSIVVVYPCEEVMQRVYDLEKTTLWLGLAGLCVLLLLVVIVSRSISKPITSLAEAARKVSAGDLQISVPRLSTNDEVAQLTEAFNKMVVDLSRHIVNLQRTTAEKERMGSELNIAREIQMSILPRTFPPFPDKEGLDIFARAIPAREMGGDFYDFFLLDDNRLGFVIADVSEKGVPAALFMAISRTLTRTNAARNLEPGECLTHVNDLLCSENESSMFVTLFYGILDLRSGEVAYANAGHNPPLVIRGGKIERLEGTGSLVLGAWEGTVYPTRRARLAEGDTIFCYTDGITEAMDEQDRIFSEQRLVDLLDSFRGRGSSTAERIIETVLGDVKAHATGVKQFDDITALALVFGSRLDSPSVTTVGQITVIVDTDADEIPRVMSIIGDFAGKQGLPPDVSGAIQDSLHRTLGVMVEQYQHDEEKHTITVRVSAADPQLVRIEVEDESRPFNPLEAVGEPASTKTAWPPKSDEVVAAASGIERRMDSAQYRRERGRNVVILEKRVGEELG